MSVEIQEFAKQIVSLMKPEIADLDKIEKLLQEQHWTHEKLAEFALLLAEKVEESCLSEDDEEEAQQPSEGDLLPDVVKILLALGLNPNEYYEDDSILNICIWELEMEYRWVTKLLKVLLDGGANPNLKLPNDFLSIFEYVDGITFFDRYSENWVKASMLLSVYGGYYRIYKEQEVHSPPPLNFTIYDEEKHPRDWFKNIDAFSLVIERISPAENWCWKAHLIDKVTGAEIGWYGNEA